MSSIICWIGTCTSLNGSLRSAAAGWTAWICSQHAIKALINHFHCRLIAFHLEEDKAQKNGGIPAKTKNAKYWIVGQRLLLPASQTMLFLVIYIMSSFRFWTVGWIKQASSRWALENYKGHFSLSSSIDNLLKNLSAQTVLFRPHIQLTWIKTDYLCSY